MLQFTQLQFVIYNTQFCMAPAGRVSICLFEGGGLIRGEGGLFERGGLLGDILLKLEVEVIRGSK